MMHPGTVWYQTGTVQYSLAQSGTALYNPGLVLLTLFVESFKSWTKNQILRPKIKSRSSNGENCDQYLLLHIFGLIGYLAVRQKTWPSGVPLKRASKM